MAGTGPKQLSNQRVSARNISSSLAALIVHTVDESGAFVSPGAGSTQVSIKEILSSSGGSLIDSSNVSLGVTIRAGSAAGTEYTDGDVDATISGGAILFDNSSNTLRPVTLTRGLPVNVVAGSAASTTATVRQSTASDLLMEPRLSTANANSSAYLPVRLTDGSGFIAPSTVVSISTGSVRVIQSTAADLNVTVAGYSTTVNVSSLAGAVIIRSSAADALVTAYQSTFTDLQALAGIRDRDSSTQVAAVLNATPASTAYAVVVRLPAPITDSTNNALRVFQVASSAGAGSTEVTVRQSTYTDFNTLSRLADRDNSTKVAAVLSETQPASSAYGVVVRLPAPFADSTNNAIRVFTVASSGGAGSTEVTIRQSTYTDLNTLSRLADRDASTQVANITNTTPASSAYGLVVREAVAQSTTVNVSSLGGAVIVRSSAANALVTVYQSTAADLVATARVNTSSGGAVEGSTASPAHGVIGLHVRQVPSSMATFAASTVGATSTNTTLVSSLAGARVKVYAFSVTSTVVANSTVSFRSSAATVLWPLVLGSGSSGVTGANLAVAPPAFLFATASANALTFHTPSSGPEFHVAVSYFVEP